MNGEIVTSVAAETVTLLPQRALYWQRARTLMVADPHFGKAATFRARGVPVPRGTGADNLARLSAALSRTGAERLLILGDLLHAADGRSPATLAAVARWRAAHAQLEIVLIRGNHDAHAGDPPPAWRMTCVDEPWEERPFIFRHRPQPEEGGYVLAGHQHPAVRLSGCGGLGETLACFYFGPRVGVLPAFGEFTGTAVIRPQPAARVFVIAADEVMAVE